LAKIINTIKGGAEGYRQITKKKGFGHDKILPEFFSTPPQLTVGIANNQFPALRTADLQFSPLDVLSRDSNPAGSDIEKILGLKT